DLCAVFGEARFEGGQEVFVGDAVERGQPVRQFTRCQQRVVGHARSFRPVEPPMTASEPEAEEEVFAERRPRFLAGFGGTTPPRSPPLSLMRSTNGRVSP